MFDLHILDPAHGHFTHSWDIKNPVEVEKAREMFNSLRKIGYLIYETKQNPTSGETEYEAVNSFDGLHNSYYFKEPTEQGQPNIFQKVARQLTARPQIAGG